MHRVIRFQGMGTLRRALILGLAIVTAPLAASAAPGLLLSEQVDDKAKIEIGYLGEGWRNLRKVVVFTTFTEFEYEAADEYYFACETSTLISPAQIPAKEGVWVHAGNIADLQIEGSLGMITLTPALRSSVIAALASTCNKPAARQVRPAHVGLAASRDQVSYLLAERFERTGPLIKMWMRSDYTMPVNIDASFTAVWGPVPGLDKSRGHVISKMEINCDTSRYRRTNYVTYDASGEPVPAKSAASEFGAFDEAIPGTVGESEVQRACLIR